jgi:hypothetical protein
MYCNASQPRLPFVFPALKHDYFDYGAQSINALKNLSAFAGRISSSIFTTLLWY